MKERKNEWMRVLRHIDTEVIYCHKILSKSGPLSLLKNNDKAVLFQVKEEKEVE